MTTPTKMKNPPHPGRVIAQEILAPLELNVTAAAQALAIARPTLSNLLNGKMALTWDMAIRIEKAFGPKADHLMRMQFSFDETAARARQQSIAVKKFTRASTVR